MGETDDVVDELAEGSAGVSCPRVSLPVGSLESSSVGGSSTSVSICS